MKILIAYPDIVGITNGNQVTAQRWCAILKELGHEVETAAISDLAPVDCDLLIALHAIKSAGLIETFQEQSPDKPVIVAITGTDIYTDQDQETLKKSLAAATRIVVLQEATAQDVPASWRSKVQTIYQSVVKNPNVNIDINDGSRRHLKNIDWLLDAPPGETMQPVSGSFNVCIVGNLRDPKDPFLTAIAVRDLPLDSKIQVTQFGAAMSDEMHNFAEQETSTNSRYRWVGSVSHAQTLNAIAQADLLVNSSKAEGGSAAVSEAIGSSTPILATRIAGNRGLLGDDYSGMFEVGDANQLRDLLLEAEQKEGFFHELKRQCNNRQHLITPKFERETWANLLNEIEI